MFLLMSLNSEKDEDLLKEIKSMNFNSEAFQRNLKKIKKDTKNKHKNLMDGIVISNFGTVIVNFENHLKVNYKIVFMYTNKEIQYSPN